MKSKHNIFHSFDIFTFARVFFFTILQEKQLNQDHMYCDTEHSSFVILTSDADVSPFEFLVNFLTI